MKQFVLVAHGAPSDPDPADERLKLLAASVAMRAPSITVRGATLARPGSLRAALSGLHDPQIYPFFMADGWFTRVELPRRLREIGDHVRLLSPFGCDPDLPDLIARVTLEAAGAQAESTNLILAAHGSRQARRSKDSVYAMADALRGRAPFRTIRVGLIEEPPFLEDVAAECHGGICLPFFALRAGHVTTDIPKALQAAGFQGQLLPAIGEHPEISEMIARAILRA